MKKFELVYVEYTDWADEGEAPRICNLPNGFSLDWGAKGCGFGMLDMCKCEGGLYLGDEYMGLNKSAEILEFFCKGKDRSEWPLLLQEYESVEAALANVVDVETVDVQAVDTHWVR